MTSTGRYILSVLLDLWEKSRLRRVMSIMLSPLIQICPSPQRNSRSKKRPRHVETVSDKSLDEFAEEVKVLFEQPLDWRKLMTISDELQKEYKNRLLSSKISMLPSYQHTLPSGDEHGDYLALDVGGSTFRIALVRLGGRKCEDGGFETKRIRSFQINESIRRLHGEQFFDWIADKIGEMLTEHDHMTATSNAKLPMGVAWSFPIEQTSSRSGNLLPMGKGFCAALGCEGEDLNELIMKSCRKRNLNVEMRAIVNDGAATLLSQAYRDPSARISLILGTGMNAAIYLPVSALAHDKFGERPDSWHAAAKHVLVNTELSMFGGQILPITRWDEILNKQHVLPDFQPMEYLMTGRYIGEIVRLVMVEAIQTAGLFDGQMPENFSEPYTFDTRIVAAFESDASTTLSTSCSAFIAAHHLPSQPRLAELQFLREVAKLVSKRAEAFLAAALHALSSLRTASEGVEPGEASHVSIACHGTIVEKYPNFRASCQGYLDRLTELSGAAAGAITLEMAPESSIYGAAVAVCCSKES